MVEELDALITKNTIDSANCDCFIKQKGTNGQPSRIFCERIEYLHKKKKDSFHHHLFFYNHGLLVFKVWLSNRSEDMEFKDIFEALESVKIKCLVPENEE